MKHLKLKRPHAPNWHSTEKKDVSVYFFSSLTKHIYSENFPMIQARWTIGQKDEEEEEVKKGGKSSGGSGSAANQA
jgi:hypothetical protein